MGTGAVEDCITRFKGLLYPPFNGVDVHQGTFVDLLLGRQADGKGLPDLVRLLLENYGTNGEHYCSQLGG
ncbi:MAG: hypothetical protein ACYCY0_01095 [Acidithiobacillus ferrivorans]